MSKAIVSAQKKEEEENHSLNTTNNTIALRTTKVAKQLTTKELQNNQFKTKLDPPFQMNSKDKSLHKN